MLAGKGSYDEHGEYKALHAVNAVVGTGEIASRRIVVSADDFTIRAGSSEATVSEKWIYAERYAHRDTSCRSCGWSTPPAAASSCSSSRGPPRSPAIRCCR